MEQMNVTGGEQWQGPIAMYVFGDRPTNEEVGLLAHIDGCPDCRALAEEMSETHAVLGYVDARAVAPTASVPPGLAAKVLGDLRRAEVAQHRRSRARVAGLSGIGLVAAALIVVVIVSVTSVAPPAQRTFVLRGASSISASAVLSERSWGTSIDLHEQGLPGGQVYTVSMRTATGSWWVAGTYTSVSGQAVDAQMACAVKLRQISGVRVSDASGRQVLSSYGTNSY